MKTIFSKVFRISTIAILVIFQLFVISCSTSNNNWENFYEETKILCDSAKIPAMQVYYQSSEITASFTFGDFPVRPDSAIFQAASLSKPILAYITMKMYERDEIDLDLPLYKYTDIDRFTNKEWAAKLTARNVLHHRTGLPNWSCSPSSDTWPTNPIDFLHRPDSCFSYSGEGIAMLQRAIEKIIGDSIQVIAENEVFIPLGMNSSSYIWRDDYETRAVYGYNSKGEKKGRGNYPRANTAYTLRTTSKDYSRFLTEILNIYNYAYSDSKWKEKRAKKECYAQLSKANAQLFFDGPQAVRYSDKTRDCDANIYWGLSLGIEKHKELGTIFWHWGDNGTYKALFTIVPEQNSFLVYFTNSSNGHNFINEIVPIYFGNQTDVALSDWILN